MSHAGQDRADALGADPTGGVRWAAPTRTQVDAVVVALADVDRRVGHVRAALGERRSGRGPDLSANEIATDLRLRAIAGRTCQTSLASVVPRSLRDFLA